MYIIAGLGNPGREYENTRHNAGFASLDALAKRHGIELTTRKFQALVGSGYIDAAYTEAATADQLLPLIRNHLGVGFVPEMLAREAVEKGEVFEIPLTEPIPEREILLVEDGSRPLSIAAERLRQMLEEGRR